MTGAGSFWFANPSSGFYNGVATQSARFDDGSSAFLHRTPSSASNRKTFVFSAWIKRGALGGNKSFFGSYFANDNNSQFYISFNSSDKLVVSLFSTYTITSDAVFRDISSWYHVVVACDVTQSTDSNRWEVYVNGQEITFTGTYPPNADTAINSTNAHYVGHNNVGGFHFDGYMAEVNFIDGLSFFSDTSGTANTSFNINSFGELKNGVWIAKKYTGSYGTNGFRLQFDQTGVGTASTSTIGADTSGNNNHYTSSGIVASDCNMPDCPENNFPTLNPIAPVVANTPTYSEGNLRIQSTWDTNWRSGIFTFKMTSGKWYFEFRPIGGSYQIVGIASEELDATATSATQYLGKTATGYGYQSNDGTVNNNSSAVYTGSAYGTSNTIGVAVDLDNNKLYFAEDNTWQNSGNPTSGSTGTGAVSITDKDGYFVVVSVYETSSVGQLNFGQDSTFSGTISAGGNADDNGIGDFAYAPPSGYLALCSSNLPELTIGPNSLTQADDHFNTTTWTAESVDGSTKTITVGFKPDFIWGKPRNRSADHMIVDSSRGFTTYLRSNGTNAEATFDSFVSNAVTSTGYDLDDDEDGYFNYAPDGGTADTMVAWNWKANGGTTTTNDASATGVGTIDSVYQANTTAGFSIVQYEATGSAGTIAHGLSQAPTFMIVKSRDQAGTSWMVYYGDNTDYLRLESDGDTIDGQSTWNDTTPTSSVFSVGVNGGDTNNSLGGSMIGYIFHDVEGYSKFGSYIANNSSSDNTFVHLGFRPAFVLVKGIGLTQEFAIVDNVRDPFNDNASQVLYPNYTNTENTDGSNKIDLVSNGFKIRSTASFGYGTGTYIYMAFAEAPFKYANAR
jgi:hypothetical protein